MARPNVRSPLLRPALTFCLLAGALPEGVAAQGAAPAAPAPASPNPADASSAPIVYTPADFARFNPRSALDMVNHLPNFRLTEVSEDRGFGQASQNVLINGARVSGKSNDATTELGRIAADAVLRIEIVDGSTLGIAGLAGRVANVIVASDNITVQYHWDPQFRRNVEPQLYTGAISANGRIGASEISLSLSNNNGARRAGVGPQYLYDGAGTLVLRRDERDTFHSDQPRLAGSLHRSWADGSVLNLNLTGDYTIFNARFVGVGTPFDGGTPFDDLFIERDRDTAIEGGGDYAFNLGGGQLKLIGLQRYTYSTSLTRFTQTDRTPGALTDGTQLNRIARQGESVARAEYSWDAGNWQIAIEGAYNYIRTHAEIGQGSEIGAYRFNPLVGGNIFVDEWRGDASITRNMRLGSTLSAQVTLGGEYSRISDIGAGSHSRGFQRPKGSVSLTWTPSPRLTVNGRLQRRVGQLSFIDFSAAVDLQNDAANAANGSLVPEQAWRIEAEASRTLGPVGSLTIGGYGERISDIVDRVPLSPTTEGVGNLPRATRYGLTIAGTLLFDRIGWHGGRIDLVGDFRESTLRDPVTGINRSISNDLERNWTLQLRHDIPHSPIAWGGLLTESRNVPIFRLDQTYRATLTNAVAQVYVEHKNVMGLTVRVTLRNLLGARDDIIRDYYVDRRDGPIAYRQRQLREIHLIGLLTVSGSF